MKIKSAEETICTSHLFTRRILTTSLYISVELAMEYSWCFQSSKRKQASRDRNSRRLYDKFSRKTTKGIYDCCCT